MKMDKIDITKMTVQEFVQKFRDREVVVEALGDNVYVEVVE